MGVATLVRRPAEPLRALRALLPRGGLLPEDAWRARHRWILLLLAGHSVFILGYALAREFWPPHALLEALVPAAAAGVARRETLGRRERAMVASLGLLSSSAILVHISGGYIEAHFHFFVMLIVISLYQEWSSFLLAIGYVVLHHGLVGVIDATSVYNHPDAVANPWKWAAIHGLFIAGASGASLATWRLTEDTMLARLASERKARLAAEHGVKQREDFLSVATHELRTPVASVKGYAQLAMRSLESPHGVAGLRPTLEMLDRQTDRLSGLITQLLDASRIEAGRLELEPLRTELQPLVLNVVQVARQRADPALDWEIDVAAVDAVVDPARIEQVVTNLVENAVRYTPAGGTVTVRLWREGPAVALEVRDTGVGIAPEHLDRIFERFYQAAQRRTYSGMGLGLYIAREIVQRHRGRIEVDSQPGRGSRFTVRLPALTSAAAEPDAPAAVARQRTVPAPPPPRGSSVLVVEDDPAIRHLVQAVLRDDGLEALAAASGVAALEVLELRLPDLILLDKLMPEMDGTTFASEYRARPGPHAPIVGLCAARDAAEWAASIGAVAWVAKPFDLDDLVSTVRRQLRGSGEALAAGE